VEEAATTPATRPTEGRTKEEAATTASSWHRGPTVARCHLFASLATNRATPTPARAPGSAGRPAQAPRSIDCGCLTHLTEEEARDAPDVVTGEYLKDI
jgi:hypothetical protein